MASNMLEWADAPEGETKLTFVEKEMRVKEYHERFDCKC